MFYLYRSWDDSLYISEAFDGEEGLLLMVSGSTTVKDLIKWLTLPEIGEVMKAMHGEVSEVEMFI